MSSADSSNRRRKRPTWLLSSVRPDQLIYDVQTDDYQKDDDAQFFDTEQSMTEWHDGTQELAPRGFEDDDADAEFDYGESWPLNADSDDDAFFDTCDLEDLLPISEVESDDFQSCASSMEGAVATTSNRSGGSVISDAAGDDLDLVEASPPSAAASVASQSSKESDDYSTNEEIEVEKASLRKSAKNLLSLGVHIKDTNVFAIERLSDRVVTGLMASYYVVFTLLVIYSVVMIFRETLREYQIAIVPNGTTDNATYICLPQGSGCVPNTAVSIDQASLLINTVVVSGGLDVNNWRGNGALPGTPAFSAQNITPTSAFITGGEALNYDSNPEIHENWENIQAALWLGGSLIVDDAAQGVLSAEIAFRFRRSNGMTWPENILTEDISIAAHMYACTRGSNCTSVGAYREQLLQPAFGPSHIFIPKMVLSNDRSEISLSLILPNSLLGSGAIGALAWRFTFFGGSFFPLCVHGDGCNTFLEMKSAWADFKPLAILDSVLLICYYLFFFFWIMVLLILSGMPWKWALEQKWLLLLGLSLCLYNNPFSVALELSSSYKMDYVFSEFQWFTSLVISHAGLVLQYFTMALFADSPRHFVSPFYSFYWPKMCFCFVYFLSSVVISIWRFPQLNSRDQPGDDRTIGGLGFVTTPLTWAKSDKVIVVLWTFVVAACILITFFYYFIRCHITSSVLNALPYNMTRPVQISFRFYVWATFIWVVGELVVFAISCVKGLADAFFGELNQNSFDFFDRAIIALDLMQFFTPRRNPATVLFGTVFTAIFQFLLSPPSALGPVKTPRTHYKTENEAISETKRLKAGGFRVPKNILILQRGRLLVICSREAYLPLEDEWNALGDSEVEKLKAEALKSQENGKEKKTRNALADSFLPMNMKPTLEDRARKAGTAFGIDGKQAKGSAFSVGCRVVAYISEPRALNIHDTKAIIFRHLPSGALIVSFRGTMSIKQVKTDMMQYKQRVSLDTFLAVLSEREMKRRRKKSIDPAEEEQKLLNGSQTKVNLLDLMHCEDDTLPDYLQSATQSRSRSLIPHGRIHFGFWSSYNRVRRDIHSHVKRELLSQPGPLFLCGHSLGGSLATVCAYDMARWMLPTVKKALKSRGNSDLVGNISLSVYTYGSPRCGDLSFAKAYDNLVKDTQRIVCDGDIITSGPPTWMGYKHCGRESIFDFTGSLRVDPSIVEQATLRSRTNPNSHRLANYALVIKMAYQPHMSTLDLLNLLREAYGIDKITRKKKARSPRGHEDEKDAKKDNKKDHTSAPQVAAPSPKPKAEIQSSPNPAPVPYSNAFDIMFN